MYVNYCNQLRFIQRGTRNVIFSQPEQNCVTHFVTLDQSEKILDYDFLQGKTITKQS